jgi:starvation-inducible outer membrane lipoprotein
VAALLAGCASQPQNAGGQGPSQADLAKLSAGASTEGREVIVVKEYTREPCGM